MRDTVIYAGGFGLPDRTASALRALGNAEVFRLAGYRVLVSGKFAKIPEPASQPVEVNGFSCYDIRRPLPGLPSVDYTRSPANICALALHAGVDRIAAIMAYNYPGFGLWRLIRLAKELGVPIINESTEWYGWEGFRPVSNVRRIVESRLRNTVLVKRAGNFVCATRWSRDQHPEANTLVLPFALHPDWECWQGQATDEWKGHENAIRLVYAGSPGMGMHKDRLPLIVEALGRIEPAAKKLSFVVMGITAQDYLRSMPRHAALLERLAGNLRFLGRMPHRDVIGILKGADFSVFVRERNRVSTVGFPTKYAEAVTCGVPVFTNDSSDIARYLKDGENGILLPGIASATIESGLARIAHLSRNDMERVKANVANHNPFAVDAWVPRLQAFMQQLRMPQ